MLASTTFEEVLLDESQRNIAWLLSEFDPGSDKRDELLLKNIIGDQGNTEEKEDASLTLN